MVERAPDWSAANHAALVAEVASVRAALERHAAGTAEPAPAPSAHPAVASSLDTVCERFELSPFERKLLVLCAAVALEGDFAALCARAHGNPACAYPTFGLALAAFGDAHWSALTPSAPLRRWGLVDLVRDEPVTVAPLRLNESVLHELTGISELDAGLAPYLVAVDAPLRLVPSHARSADRVASLWNGAARGAKPVVRLGGCDARAKREIAAAAFASGGLATLALDGTSIPHDALELDRLARACGREMVLHAAGLYVDAHAVGDPADRAALGRFVQRAAAYIVVGCDQPLRIAWRPACSVDVDKPSRAEQRALWTGALADTPGVSRAAVDRLAGQFDLGAGDLCDAVELAATEPGENADARVWAAARRSARGGLDEIAERIDVRSGWDDLVLPAQQMRTLADIVAHARNRARVYEDWDMGTASRRGLGIGVLFYGPSGTGKTLAAEVLGCELALDVYRVDLSQLVSKWIGETEKNLRRVFDAAEGGGSLLLFDECDALFGKRGEVQSAHDRYANVEVSYLLQRMEAYRGVAILTTNMRNAIDPAFMRRLRFVVPFPFPDYEQRIAIWRRSFATAVPTEGLDVAKLARLNVAGGNIRNIALYAAFLAADAGEPVRMTHLLRAAQAECAKIERAPSELEIGGWA